MGISWEFSAFSGMKRGISWDLVATWWKLLGNKWDNMLCFIHGNDILGVNHQRMRGMHRSPVHQTNTPQIPCLNKG